MRTGKSQNWELLQTGFGKWQIMRGYKPAYLLCILFLFFVETVNKEIFVAQKLSHNESYKKLREYVIVINIFYLQSTVKRLH